MSCYPGISITGFLIHNCGKLYYGIEKQGFIKRCYLKGFWHIVFVKKRFREISRWSGGYSNIQIKFIDSGGFSLHTTQDRLYFKTVFSKVTILHFHRNISNT